MDQIAAFKETLNLALSRDYDNIGFDEEGVDYVHLQSMWQRLIDGRDTVTGKEFSEAKIGRWLGYIQGVLVANGCITLEEAKEINKRHS